MIFLIKHIHSELSACFDFIVFFSYNFLNYLLNFSFCSFSFSHVILHFRCSFLINIQNVRFFILKLLNYVLADSSIFCLESKVFVLFLEI